MAVKASANLGLQYNCYCSIKQLPRVEYCHCSILSDNNVNFNECVEQKAAEGWYPLDFGPRLSGTGTSSSTYTQAFWRFAQ